jgi:hypothetical protein
MFCFNAIELCSRTRGSEESFPIKNVDCTWHVLAALLLPALSLCLEDSMISLLDARELAR